MDERFFFFVLIEAQIIATLQSYDSCYFVFIFGLAIDRLQVVKKKKHAYIKKSVQSVR